MSPMGTHMQFFFRTLHVSGQVEPAVAGKIPRQPEACHCDGEEIIGLHPDLVLTRCWRFPDADGRQKAATEIDGEPQFAELAHGVLQ